ncbi:unnamed protein product, partial [Iphiclides podalirius]
MIHAVTNIEQICDCVSLSLRVRYWGDTPPPPPPNPSAPGFVAPTAKGEQIDCFFRESAYCLFIRSRPERSPSARGP